MHDARTGQELRIGRLPGLLARAGNRAIPIALASVLLAAGGFKAYQLATAPPPEESIWTSRPFLIALVEIELGLGLWLLSGYRQGAARAVALALFGSFTLFSGSQVLAGARSCGCFGGLSLNPLYTFAFDVVALLGLVRWRPAVYPVANGSLLVRVSILGLVFLTGGISVGVAMATYRPVRLDDPGQEVGDSVVLLEPAAWVGRPLPLRKYIDIGDELVRGRWIVVLYRHDCSECRHEVPRYGQLAFASAQDRDAPRVAFIEVPPYGSVDFLVTTVASPYRAGMLRDTKKWFVTTPAVVFVADGVVRPPTEGETWLRRYY